MMSFAIAAILSISLVAAPASDPLARARSELAQLKRDPAKRRLRHHWDKVFRDFERAARTLNAKQAAEALQEASSARNALFALFAIQADREEAARLADRAAKARAPVEEARAEPEVQDAESSSPAESDANSDGAIRRIVIDAGHGGHDTGAIGPTRVREKDVVMALARRLAKKLEAAGYRVVLTRNGDQYLSLDQRTAIANSSRGDLFISIHANAHARRDRHGIETYFLNVTDDRYAARLAARENGASAAALEETGAVRRILSDLDAKSSADASRRLAQLVQHAVCASVRDRYGDVRDLGVKSALFHVLLGARMPAVLVETGFVSNGAEEKRLTTGQYAEQVADGIAQAVQSFATREAKLAAAP